MLAYGLVLLNSIIGGVSSATQKLWQKRTFAAGNAPYIYLVLNAISACVIFCVMAGFNLKINTVSLMYAAGYGAVVILSIVLNMMAMSRMNLILCSVFQRGSTVIVWLIGILFFHEELKVNGAVSALLILISILIPLSEIKTGKTKISDFFIGTAIAVVGTSSTILLKCYTFVPNRAANTVLFFYTNVFVIAFIAFLALACFGFIFEKQNIISDIKMTKKHFWIVPLSTLCSNAASLISVYVIKIMPLSVYSIVSYAVGCVVVFVNSKIVFGEKFEKADLAAFVLSASAVLINLL